MNSRIIELYKYLQFIVSSNRKRTDYAKGIIILKDNFIESFYKKYQDEVFVLKIGEMLFVAAYSNKSELQLDYHMITQGMKNNIVLTVEDYASIMGAAGVGANVHIGMNSAAYAYINSIALKHESPALVLDVMMSYDDAFFNSCMETSKAMGDRKAFEDMLIANVALKDSGLVFSDEYEVFLAIIMSSILRENYDKYLSNEINAGTIYIMDYVLPIEYFSGHLSIDKIYEPEVRKYLLLVYRTCELFKDMPPSYNSNSVESFIREVCNIDTVKDLAMNVSLFGEFKTHLTELSKIEPVILKMHDSYLLYKCIDFYKPEIDKDLKIMFIIYNSLRNIYRKVEKNEGIYIKQDFMDRFIRNYSFILVRVFAYKDIKDEYLTEVLELALMLELYRNDQSIKARPTDNNPESILVAKFKEDKMFNLLVTMYLLDKSKSTDNKNDKTSSAKHILREPMADWKELASTSSILNRFNMKELQTELMNRFDMSTHFPYVSYDPELEAKTRIIFGSFEVLNGMGKRIDVIFIFLTAYILRSSKRYVDNPGIANDIIQEWFKIFDKLYGLDILNDQHRLDMDKYRNLELLHVYLELIVDELTDPDSLANVLSIYNNMNRIEMKNKEKSNKLVNLLEKMIERFSSKK